MSENNNFEKEDQGKLYSEKLGRFEERIQRIMQEDLKSLKKIEGLVKFLESIKQQVLRLIKKPSGGDSKKRSRKASRVLLDAPMSSQQQPGQNNVNKLGDASTKMTEEDRALTTVAFALDNEGGLLSHKAKQNVANMDVSIFDLTTDNIELPRVRLRSNSFHLGKRRMQELKEIDGIADSSKILKTGKASSSRFEAFGSPFFVMTNQFYKHHDALLRIRVKNM